MGYTTWDSGNKSAKLTLSGGDLVVTRDASANAWATVLAVHGKSSGKWYFEVTNDSGTSVNGDQCIGIGLVTHSTSNQIGAEAADYACQYNNTATSGQAIVVKNAVNTQQSWGGNWANSAGESIGVAVDLDNGKIWFRANGGTGWVNGGDPAAGTNPSYSGISGTYYPAVSLFSASRAVTANFGASSFVGAVPSGFTAGWTDPNLSVSVTGQAITSALGSVSLAGVDVPVSVTGQAITSALGSVSLTGIDVPVPVTGQAITSALGTVLIPQDATAAITGQAITGALGTVTFGPGVVTKVYVTHTEGVGLASVLATGTTYRASISNTLGLASAATVARRLIVAITESLALEGTTLAHGTYAVTVVDALAFVAPLNVDADEAWVINLNTKAVTRYENYGFTSFCRRQDKYLGAKGSKIYEITGNADAAAEIATYVTSGKLDMEGGMMARLFDVFINAEVEYDSFLTFKIVIEDDVEYQYQKRVTNIFPDPLRMKLGKGLRSRFWEFELGHSSSLPSTVESIKLPFEPTKRRI